MSPALLPCCARLHRSGNRWFAFIGHPERGAINAAQLVLEAPEFLGMLATNARMTRAAMVAPEAESRRVLVAFDEAGGVELVACPQPGVAGDMAALVGEILTVSTRLSQQKRAAIAAQFAEHTGEPLVESVRSRAPAGWSEQSFAAGLDRSLAQGHFPVVVVVEDADEELEQELAQLREMNLPIRVLGYSRLVCGRDEVVRPRLIGAEPAPVAAPAPAAPAQQPEPKPAPAFSTAYVEEHVETVSVVPASRRETAVPEQKPFPASDASPKQQEILAKLRHLDELGLRREGFEYFLPGAEQKETSEGTIVIAIDANRWPFPKDDEVIVVVRTGQDHLARFLKIAPNEVETFLESLPRVERKEHKDAMLLRASTIYEAAQLVNELKALKEVSVG